MKKPLLTMAGLLSLVMVLSASLAAAQAPAGKEMTVKGEIVDTACFMAGEKMGAAHKECAIACMKGGQDMGLYDAAAKTLYIIVGAKAGEDPNAKIKDFVAQTVEATGTIMERGGAKAIAIKSVKAAK